MNKILILSILILLPIAIFGQKKNNIDTSQVYIIVESMPTMPDGSDLGTGIREFISKELKYPDSMNCDYISTIIFEFTISYNGTVIDKNISFRSMNNECPEDFEKLRKVGMDILNKLPKFIPGKHKEKYVNVKFKFPVRILLQ